MNMIVTLRDTLPGPATLVVRGLTLQIVEHLRRDLLSGALRAGEPLNQAELTERFGVSRTPIREALIQLANEGLVVKRRDGRSVVAGSTTESTHDLLWPAWASIELEALRHAIDHCSQADFRFWRQNLAEMHGAAAEGDRAGFAESELEFRRHCVELANEPTATRVWSLIAARLARNCIPSATQAGYTKDVTRHYTDLVEKAEAGDTAGAVRAHAKRLAALQ